MISIVEIRGGGYIRKLLFLVAVMVCAGIIVFFFFFSSRRRHTRFDCDWSSDVCSSDLGIVAGNFSAFWNGILIAALMGGAYGVTLYGNSQGEGLNTFMGEYSPIFEIGRASCRERV